MCGKPTLLVSEVKQCCGRALRLEGTHRRSVVFLHISGAVVGFARSALARGNMWFGKRKDEKAGENKTRKTVHL